MITIVAHELARLTREIIGVAGKNQESPSSLAILAVKDGAISLYASSGVISLRTSAPIEDDASIDIAVSAHKLHRMATSVHRDERIVLHADRAALHLRWSSGSCRLSTLPSADVPRIDDAPTLCRAMIAQRDLRALLVHTLYAAEKGRSHSADALACVSLVSSNGALSAVATDRCRIACCTLTQHAASTDYRYLMPYAAASELVKILRDDDDDIELVVMGDRAKIMIGHREIMMTASAMRFPDCEKIQGILSSAKGANEVHVSRDEMRSALERVALMADEEMPILSLAIDDESVEISTENSLGETASDSIAARGSPGAKVAGDYQLRYIAEPIAAVRYETISVSLGDRLKLRPCVMRAEDDRSRWTYMVAAYKR